MRSTRSSACVSRRSSTSSAWLLVDSSASFEIARNFRNEGIDTRHSPEFTSLEAYRAFGDFTDGMDLTEHLIVKSARGAVRPPRVRHVGSADRPHPALAQPGPARPARGTSGATSAPLHAGRELRSVCETNDVPYLPAWGSGKLIFELYDKVLMTNTVGPIFVYHYPTEVSPLARRSLDDPTITDRFELVVGGRELANGYSELNDPDEQAERFRAEAAAAAERRPGSSSGRCRVCASPRVRPTTDVGHRCRYRPAHHALGRGTRHPRRHPLSDHAAGGGDMIHIQEVHEVRDACAGGVDGPPRLRAARERVEPGAMPTEFCSRWARPMRVNVPPSSSYPTSNRRGEPGRTSDRGQRSSPGPGRDRSIHPGC